MEGYEGARWAEGSEGVWGKGERAMVARVSVRMKHTSMWLASQASDTNQTRSNHFGSE